MIARPHQAAALQQRTAESLRRYERLLCELARSLGYDVVQLADGAVIATRQDSQQTFKSTEAFGRWLVEDRA